MNLIYWYNDVYHMTATEIFNELEEKSIGKCHFFGRHVILVRSADFDRYRPYFIETANILNDKENYRTREVSRHVHAMKSGDLVGLHMDYANLYRFSVMAVPHLFFDVIPYFLYFSVVEKKLGDVGAATGADERELSAS